MVPFTRYLNAVAVIGSFLLATTLILYAGVQTIRLVWLTIASGQVTLAGGKALLLGSIELADLFLLGTVFYIIAIGLYDLFMAWDGDRDLLRYGAGIALVIAALTYFLCQQRARA